MIIVGGNYGLACVCSSIIQHRYDSPCMNRQRTMHIHTTQNTATYSTYTTMSRSNHTPPESYHRHRSDQLHHKIQKNHAPPSPSLSAMLLPVSPPLSPPTMRLNSDTASCHTSQGSASFLSLRGQASCHTSQGSASFLQRSGILPYIANIRHSSVPQRSGILLHITKVCQISVPLRSRMMSFITRVCQLSVQLRSSKK